MKVLVFPAFLDNPFTQILYSKSESFAVSPTYTDDFEEFLSELRCLCEGDTIHFQWTQVVTNAPDKKTASRRVRLFKQEIIKAVKKGINLVWTVHNKVPHESAYLDLEVSLARFLSKKSLLIHIMNAQTALVAKDLYKIPESKISVVPHPSYLGSYPVSKESENFRQLIGVPDQDLLVLFFGQVRPYKGLGPLIDAVEHLSAQGTKITLLIAGRLHPSMHEIKNRIAQSSAKIICHLEPISKDSVSKYFSTADVVALPYSSVLNSGSAVLAATYGKRIVLPNFPHLVNEFGQGEWVTFYDSNMIEKELPLALIRFQDSVNYSSNALKYAEEVSPANVSSQFLELLTQL